MDIVEHGIAGSNPKVELMLFVVFIINYALPYNSHCIFLNFDAILSGKCLAVFRIVIMLSSSGHNLVLAAKNAAGGQMSSSN